MKKTLICHYYNEQFLLPHYCRWHREMFDHIVFIDYDSTDLSNDIIRELCPSYEIIKPQFNDGFHARDLDREVVEAEKRCEGWKLCLNVTEFVFHDDFANYLDGQPETVKGIWLPVISMVDKVENKDKELDPDKPLVLQRTTGQFGCGNVRNTANGRLVHRAEHGCYVGWGRHASSLGGVISPGDVYHLWFGWSPWNEEFIKRKDQIKYKIQDDDMKIMAMGSHMLNRQGLENRFLEYQGAASPLMGNEKYQAIYKKIEKKYNDGLLN